MIILNFILLRVLTIPLFANEVDDEIIKNLDFFQNIELIKDDRKLALKKSPVSDSIDDRLYTEKENLPKNDLFHWEKK